MPMPASEIAAPIARPIQAAVFDGWIAASGKVGRFPVRIARHPPEASQIRDMAKWINLLDCG